MARAPMATTTRAARGPGHLRLGVNIDHVATIRNARGGRHPDPLRAAHLGAQVVELRTGAYCDRALDDDAGGLARELDRLARAARAAAAAGLEVHAGHGLTFNTVGGVARITEVVELNIGHFLVGEAIFGGLAAAIARMRVLMDAAR